MAIEADSIEAPKRLFSEFNKLSVSMMSHLQIQVAFPPCYFSFKTRKGKYFYELNNLRTESNGIFTKIYKIVFRCFPITH